jgi:hypothetical protein
MAAPYHVSARSRRDVKRNLAAEHQQAPHREERQTPAIMANRGYDVVVDVDQEV